MDKAVKTVWRFYRPRNWEKEQEDLNEASSQGWNLVKGGRLFRRFQREDTVYRYAVDYDSDLNDHNRYYELFQEQGWSLVNNTVTGWHYFRKPYDPAQPESAYQIYSDSQSAYEMQKRLAGRAKHAATYFIVIFALAFIGSIVLRLTFPETYQESIVSDIIFPAVCLLLAVICWLWRGRILRSAPAGDGAQEEG